MSKVFDLNELQTRVHKVQEKMRQNNLEAVLVYEPENVTYLTDYYTAGYNTSFQFVIILPEGAPVIVARYAEHYWVETRAMLYDKVIYWYDGESPVEATLKALRELKLQNAKIGIEGRSWRAPYAYIAALQKEFANIVDVSNIVTHIKLIKSEQEISLMRQAGKVAEKMMEAGLQTINPGISERDIAASLAKTGIMEGSDWATPGPISSGERAKHVHASYSSRIIENQDLIFLEVVPQVRSYHARFMRSIVVGKLDQGFKDMTERLVEVQNKALDTVRAGVRCQVPDQIYRKGILETGAVDEYHNKTFYSVGLMMAPNSYEPLEVNDKSDFTFKAGMTFHTYLVVNGFSHSETIAVTETGYEKLTNFKSGLLHVE